MEAKDYKLKSGNILRVIQDSHADSPNDWDNEDVFLVYDHRDFTVKREGFEPIDIHEYRENQPKIVALDPIPDDVEPEEIDDRFDDYHIFPVDAYIHSGVHLSLANTEDYPDRRWDVSTTGFVLVKKFTDEEPEQNLIESKAREYAEGLLETWNQYLSGDVWGFNVLSPVTLWKIEDKDIQDGMSRKEIIQVSEEIIDHEELDSCWGFYGSDPKENGMLDHINDEIDELQE